MKSALLRVSFVLATVTRACCADGEGARREVEDETVVLPQQIVVAERFNARPWLYASGPGIEVLSKLTPDESRAYAENFLQSERMLAKIVPESLWGRSSKPIILIICPGDTTTANAEQMRRIDLNRLEDDGEFRRTPTDAFAAAQRFLLRPMNSNAALQLVSYYDRDSTVFFNRRVNPDQSTVNFAAGNQGADVLLGRSLYLTLARQKAPPLPAWLAEGLPAVLAASHLNTEDHQWVVDRFVVWPKAKGVINKVVPGKTVPHLMPLKRLFEEPPPPRTSPDFAIWSYQSALFVRWTLGKGALWNFVAGIDREGVSEDLFRRCFDRSYGAVEEEMRQQFTATAGGLKFKVRMPDARPTLDFRRATDLEIRRMVAELGRLQAEFLRPQHPKLASDYLRGALATLEKNKGGATKDGEFMAVWGLCALEAGDPAKARECFEAMERGRGVSRSRPYLALARLRFEEAAAKTTDGPRKLDKAQAEQVLIPLAKALSLPPVETDEIRLLLDVCEQGRVVLDAATQEVLRSVPVLFPAEAELKRRVEVVLGRAALE